ncbi:MAG: tripartite tricarboxylate transporter substrate binding protein [Deltaproteobacteria bacterium]|nr:tripartite tricarboxylate transporter substrate binding protein [Deltaproteobacteria bacterium]
MKTIMRKNKMTILWVATILIVFTALSSIGVIAQISTAGTTSAYPNRPIVLVAPFPRGHVTDTECRRIAPLLAEALGQPVTVENWPGKSGTVALEKMKHVAPDGYTLIMHGIQGLAIAPHVMKVGYDPIVDFTPIILEFYKVGHLVLVAYPGLPVNSVQELIAYGKSNPGKLTAGSFGVATNVHLAMLQFNRLTGLTIPVAELTGANIMDEVAAGKVQLMVNFPPTVAPYAKSGKVKALAVTHGRAPLLPDVPTFEEAGLPGMDENTFRGWQGFLAPAGTPPEIVAKLNAEFWKIFQSLNDKDGKIIRHANSPEEFAAFLKAENARLGKFVKDEGIGLK